MQAAIAVGLVLLVALVASVIWLSKARTDQVKAETKSKALEAGKDRRRVGEKIMAEPTAFEPEWFRATRERLFGKDGRKP